MVEPDFNEEPFDWGAYDQIAHFRGGRGGRARTFLIGFEQLAKGRRTPRIRVDATFAQRGAQPRLLRWQMQVQDFSITLNHDTGADTINAVIEAGQQRSTAVIETPDFAAGDVLAPIVTALHKAESLDANVASQLRSLVFGARYRFGPRPYAIAPIRTKPRRTYDRRRETYHPEGEHIPMILARAKSSDPEEWNKLKTGLRAFGVESGLFKSVDVKRLGKKESDPFQLQIGIAGPRANLMDVGYGVSQILPIVVECLTTDPGQMLLMQQPEVHLHPRAQAQLGSFFGYLVKERQNRLVIETHSDYLIDRVRLDIRDGKYLKPDDVSLLYCERKGIGVDVHPIRIDSDGNLVDPPRGYRRFFLDEEKRFFGG
ncbi:MAG: AAA family ATPase [Planctomycetes bacterium]|nr:AAA family ATPase [Planctomycetota bacterium]